MRTDQVLSEDLPKNKGISKNKLMRMAYKDCAKKKLTPEDRLDYIRDYADVSEERVLKYLENSAKRNTVLKLSEEDHQRLVKLQAKIRLIGADKKTLEDIALDCFLYGLHEKERNLLNY